MKRLHWKRSHLQQLQDTHAEAARRERLCGAPRGGAAAANGEQHRLGARVTRVAHWRRARRC